MQMLESKPVERDGAIKAYLAVPVSGDIPPKVSMLISEIRLDCHENNIDLTVGMLCGNCHVDDARNYLVREFLNTECTEFFFLDSDVVSPSADIVRTIKSDREVIAGIYPFKDETNRFPAIHHPESEVKLYEDGAVDAFMVPTGFLKIKRHVLETLYEKSLKFWGRKEDRETIKPMGIIFERGYRNGERVGGDYNFCLKWASEGGKVFIDPDIDFGHIGRKEYKGNYGIHLAKLNGVDHPKFVEAVQQVKDETFDIHTFLRLHKYWDNPWSACADLYAAAYEAVMNGKGDVLETGSGITTLIMGIAADKTGRHIHTLEHSTHHLRKTFSLLKRYGVENVTLHYAPLRLYGDLFYYEIPETLPDSFTLALNDGPPRHGQERSRQGFYTILGDRIKDADWLSDDADCGPDLEEFKHYAELAGREVKVFGESSKRQFMVAMKPKEFVGSTAA